MSYEPRASWETAYRARHRASDRERQNRATDKRIVRSVSCDLGRRERDRERQNRARHRAADRERQNGAADKTRAWHP